MSQTRHIRDVDAAYRDAMIGEYEAYARSGRAAQAEHVAGVLRDLYGYDVDAQAGTGPETPKETTVPPAPENVSDAAPKETVVPPVTEARKPAGRPAKKTASKPAPKTS